jgi:hypothetical protein
VSDIDTILDQINSLIRQAEIDMDCFVALLKGNDQPRDIAHPKRRSAIQPNTACGRRPRGADLIVRLLDKTEDVKTVIVIAATFSGQRNASDCPIQQRSAMATSSSRRRRKMVNCPAPS